jgi:CDP-diacylglycerol---glycerol-3-phosphate 3-phosphatidyltransferase
MWVCQRITSMYRQVPNLITISRLILTVVFFVLLNWHSPDTFFRNMWIAFYVFLLAVGTDWLDGFLARRWKVESVFGRIVDPFVDKIMICGAFVFFSSDVFIHDMRDKYPGGTGVQPWMAVVLIGREFLITGIRGLAESKGIDFRADWAGKIKMGVQCVAAGAIIVDVAELGQVPWIHVIRDLAIWVTVAVTALSALSYIVRARRLIKE